MKRKSTNCGDWHRRWSGMIGKLYTTEFEGTYEFKGHWQGRHGQTGDTASVTFKVTEDGFEFVSGTKGRSLNFLPDSRDVNEAIEILKKK